MFGVLPKYSALPRAFLRCSTFKDSTAGRAGPSHDVSRAFLTRPLALIHDNNVPEKDKRAVVKEEGQGDSGADAEDNALL